MTADGRAAPPEVTVLDARVFADERGLFFESYNRRDLEGALGRAVDFVQDNHSVSRRGVLRGLHYQLRHPQAKLVRVVRGEVFDVAVDLRRGSQGFGRWVAHALSAENRRQLWIPEGFAHGFLVVSEELYKTTAYWRADDERCIRWDDPALAIPWPLGGARPLLSAKDERGLSLAEAPVFEDGA